MPAHIPLRLRFAGFELDEDNARLSHDGRPVPLQPKALALLCELARQPGRLLSKDALLDAVWGHRHVSESVLKTTISGIRQALGDDPRQPRFIETASRLGYRFIGAAELASEVELIGREPALHRLRQAWRRCGQTRQLVWLSGEAGIGKTRLLEAFANTGFDGLHVQGQCIEHFGEGEPYLPWLELLTELCRRDEQVLPMLRLAAPMWLLQLPWLCAEAERDALRRSCAGASPERMLREFGELLMRCCELRPLLLVLEDMHWCDSASVRLLEYLARRRGLKRLMLVCSLRPADSGQPLSVLRHDLNLRGLSEELALQPFSLEQLRDYLARYHPALPARSDLARLLYQRSEGLPLFVESLVSELLAAPQQVVWRVPEGLEGSLLRQLSHLTDEQHALLEAASVCGVEFHIGILADVLRRSEAEVQTQCQILAAGHAWLVVREVTLLADGRLDMRVAFRHALYRQLFYQRLQALSRVRLHRAVAAALLRAGSASAAELAAHFEQGKEASAAVRQLSVASSAALECFAAAQALQFACHGLALHDGSNAELELDLLLKGGIASAQLHGMASVEAGDFYGRAQALAAELADSRELGWGLVGLAQVRYGRAEYSLAHGLIERVAQLADRLQDPALELAACNLGGMLCAVLGQHNTGRQHLERGIAIAETLGEHLPRQRFVVDPLVAMSAHLGLHLLPLGQFKRAQVLCEAALLRANDLAQPMSLAVATRCAGMLELWFGRKEAVVAHAQALASLHTRYGVLQADGAGRILSGWVMAHESNGQAGYVRIREGGAILQRLGMVAGHVQVLGFIADALLAAGDWQAASQYLAQAERLAARLGERARLPELACLHAQIELARGNPLAAQEALQSALAEARSQQAPGMELKLLLELCRLPTATVQDRHALRALGRTLPDPKAVIAYETFVLTDS
ncbi:AAA family ATPase [Pseudomonas sp. SG20056]|uniref:AAA family ATPase n=1 Tax=Pseudomonas sp. SG20056 TaxID=3074146 RepID=UPI00287FB443|nr:AAA family ATPase [Pseudomonas sp. SG20056]WNF45283.1 AAA family ATPase [Pseudomonas sp. SG20056]